MSPRRRPQPLAAVAAVLAVVLLIVIVAGWLNGWRAHVMTTASMGRTAPVGAVVISRPVSAQTVRPGQILIFHPPGQPGVTFAHRVVHVDSSSLGPEFSTRGDINGSTDPWTVRGANLIGQVVLRIPVLGFLIEMLPGALCAVFIIAMVTLTTRPAWRQPARTLMTSVAASALLFYYHPLAQMALIAQTVVHGHGVASVVPTGILPVRAGSPGGTHVNLVPGQVGVVHLSHVQPGARFGLTSQIHLHGWWWLILVVWALPLIMGMRPSRAPKPALPSPAA